MMEELSSVEGSSLFAGSNADPVIEISCDARNPRGGLTVLPVAEWNTRSNNSVGIFPRGFGAEYKRDHESKCWKITKQLAPVAFAIYDPDNVDSLDVIVDRVKCDISIDHNESHPQPA